MGTDETDIFFLPQGIDFLKSNLRKKAVCPVSPHFSDLWILTVLLLCTGGQLTLA